MDKSVRPFPHISFGWTDDHENTQLHSDGVMEYHFLKHISGDIFVGTLLLLG